MLGRVIMLPLCFAENEIDGQSFLELTESEVKELLKPFKLGVFKKIIRLQKEVRSMGCCLFSIFSAGSP